MSNATAHCESCGTARPAMDGDGYTACCGELVCYGFQRVWMLGTEDVDYVRTEVRTARGCCPAVMDTRGLEVLYAVESGRLLPSTNSTVRR